MKEQFKTTRRTLIESMKALREQRNALKGLKGVSDKWDELTKQMDGTQDKIDTLSRSLGYPVKERVETKRDGKFKRALEGKGIAVTALTQDQMPKDVNGNVGEMDCGSFKQVPKAKPEGRADLNNK